MTPQEYLYVVRLIQARDLAQHALIVALRARGFDPERPVRCNDATLQIEQDPPPMPDPS